MALLPHAGACAHACGMNDGPLFRARVRYLRKRNATRDSIRHFFSPSDGYFGWSGLG